MKVALVTGASSGVGREVAGRLAAHGFRVFGTTRALAAAPMDTGPTLLQLDVADDASVHAAVDQVERTAGRIDVLVNNAGYALAGAVEETGESELRALFETNVFGTARMMRAVLPIMRAQRSGRIVNVGSILGLLPAPFFAYYSASKHALEGLSESIDHEVRPFGIRVVIIEPSYIRTKFAGNSKTVATELPEYQEMRRRAAVAFAEQTASGIDPGLVADAIATAATTKAPRLRYPWAGKPNYSRRSATSRLPACSIAGFAAISGSMGREPEFSYRALHQTARPGEARRDIRHAAGRLLPVQVRRALLISGARAHFAGPPTQRRDWQPSSSGSVRPAPAASAGSAAMWRQRTPGSPPSRRG